MPLKIEKFGTLKKISRRKQKTAVKLSNNFTEIFFLKSMKIISQERGNREKNFSRMKITGKYMKEAGKGRCFFLLGRILEERNCV